MPNMYLSKLGIRYNQDEFFQNTGSSVHLLSGYTLASYPGFIFSRAIEKQRAWYKLNAHVITEI